MAPLEQTVRGVLVIPTMRYGPGFAAVARNVRLELAAGKVVKVDARDQTTVIESVLRNDPALAHFRELGVGFNAKLVIAPGSSTVPYYGYGAGVVRLSLGDNAELGGAVRGDSVAWHFFPDATVTVGRRTLVKHGKLAR